MSSTEVNAKLRMLGAVLAVALVLGGAALPPASVSAAGCQATPFERDGKKLTAAVVNPSAPVTGDLNASGCNIGVYFDEGGGEISKATISGADYYGVVVNGIARNVGPINISDSDIRAIHDDPLGGANHGTGVIFTTLEIQGGNLGGKYSATGAVVDSTIGDYQKNGMTVNGPGAAVVAQGDVISGNGPTDLTDQNGIQISRGATALVSGNAISGNFFTSSASTGCGLIYLEAAGVRAFRNRFSGNERNVCNEGRGGGKAVID